MPRKARYNERQIIQWLKEVEAQATSVRDIGCRPGRRPSRRRVNYIAAGLPISPEPMND